MEEDNTCKTTLVTVNREDFVDQLSFNALLRQCRGGDPDYVIEDDCDSFNIEVVVSCKQAK